MDAPLRSQNKMTVASAGILLGLFFGWIFFVRPAPEQAVPVKKVCVS